MKRLETTVFEVILLIALVAFAGFKVGYIMASPPIVYDNYMVTVCHGDTVWSIAERWSDKDEDIRDVMSRILKENHLESKYIYPGQVLKVPVKAIKAKEEN